MDFGKSFSFPFQDQDWLKKLGIAALIFLIPFVGVFVVMGYGAEITKRTIRKNPVLLPGWDGFDAIIAYLIKGLQVALIGFVYALPIIMIQACSQAGLFWGQDSYDNTILTIATIFAVCFGCVTFIYALAMGMVLPAAIGNFVNKGELKAGFRFGEVFGLVRAAPGAFALTLLVGLIAGFISSLGTIACLIGVIVTSAYAITVNAQFQGQAYLAALEASGGGTSAVDPDLEPLPAYDPDATALYDADANGVIHFPED